jgi:hypothetical protein
MGGVVFGAELAIGLWAPHFPTHRKHIWTATRTATPKAKSDSLIGKALPLFGCIALTKSTVASDSSRIGAFLSPSPLTKYCGLPA